MFTTRLSPPSPPDGLDKAGLARLGYPGSEQKLTNMLGNVGQQLINMLNIPIQYVGQQLINMLNLMRKKSEKSICWSTVDQHVDI